MEFNSIGRGAEDLLKSKTFGGVSKESAMEAINKVKEQAMEAIGKVQEELDAVKGKSAQEIAELTSKNDRLDLQLKNVKNARSSEQTLANGDKIIRKVNANGAVMEKQINADGQLIRVEVTPLNGTKRRTTYNPATKKPIKTYSNTTGEEVLIKYNNNGEAVGKEKVNNKKTRRTQAKLVDTKTDACGTITKSYSDGSTETISTNNRGVTTISRHKSGNKFAGQQIESKHGVYKVKIKDKTSEASVKFADNMIYEEASMVSDNKNNIIKAETKTKNGTIYRLEKLTNRFGQDLHSYKFTTTDASGNTSFEEISEYQMNEIKKNAYDNTVLKIGDASFFTPKAMIDIIDYV